MLGMPCRHQHKLNALTGARPPMYINTSPRRKAFELLRYLRWHELRWKISAHKVDKLGKLIARFSHNNKRLWLDNK